MERPSPWNLASTENNDNNQQQETIYKKEKNKLYFNEKS
jgi:hypothetical protein